MDYQELKNKFGIVKNGDVNVAIAQIPYICAENQYRAAGIDQDGYEYEITWTIINDECEDESDACDWTNYKVIAI